MLNRTKITDQAIIAVNQKSPITSRNVYEAVIHCLQRNGIHRATAEYSGGGDSGDIVSVRYSDVNDDELSPSPEPTVLYLNEASVWDTETRSHKDGIITVEATLSSAIEDACFTAISKSGHSGWENNDGGYGNFTITAEGVFTLEHHDVIEDSDDSEYEFDVTNSDVGGQLALIGETLSKLHINNVCIEYSGEGDSGQINDITVNADVEFNVAKLVSVVIENFPVISRCYESGEFVQKIDYKSLNVNTALEEVFTLVMDSVGLSGYQNNDGGNGLFRIDQHGKGVLKHSYTTEDSTFSQYQAKVGPDLIKKNASAFQLEWESV